MYCTFCGGQNPEGSQFCAHCGRSASGDAPPPVQSPGGGPPPPAEVKCAVCGLVLGPFDQTCSRCATPRGMQVNPQTPIPGAFAPAPGLAYAVQNNSGTNQPPPPGVAGGWNWGAFFFQWIWGLNHKAYITLITLALSTVSTVISTAMGPALGTASRSPSGAIGGLSIILGLVHFGVSIWFGIKGNEWAWRGRRFNDVGHFRLVQRRWGWWTLGFFVIPVVFSVIFAVVIVGVIAAAAASGGGATPPGLRF